MSYAYLFKCSDVAAVIMPLLSLDMLLTNLRKKLSERENEGAEAKEIDGPIEKGR